MDATSTNLTGVIVECGITNEALRDFIGTPSPTWLERYGKTKMVIRENQVHDLVEVEVHLMRLELDNDGWNDSFHFAAVALAEEGQRGIDGLIQMTRPGRQTRGFVQGH